ncbi:hypothetical protein NX722_01585 [Endozoicomonas gorgoniicola]|uniref:Uncharacterized protein n=1 Tax=Endozoicomonas gorgoniicola TaxID=1234144 RepID=A0ABT3MQG0_9GAMM|nr:hypothetical protein [Endozoicomonas gorgoniicola]MCW7551353.1 hypothetical protein [Endozoicomonas gorgoniicola]
MKYFCLLVCLVLTILTTGVKAFAPPQVYALGQWDGKLCLIDTSGNESTLVCNDDPLFEKVMTSKRLPDDSKFLDRCPTPWVKRNICNIISIQELPTSPQERLQQLTSSTASSVLDQISHFLQNSLDDLAEDAISIGLPLIMTYRLYPGYVSLLSGLVLFEAMNLLLSPIGDAVGDVFEQHQNGYSHTEGESELSVRGIVSNKVEDHVKVVGYLVTYKSTLIIQFLETTYGLNALDMTDGGVVSLGSQTGLLLIKKGVFVYNTLQMAEHYRWLNEFSDALSDVVTDMLFGEPCSVRR